MLIEQGLNQKDWRTLTSSVKRANIQQLYAIKNYCDTEIIKRKEQETLEGF